MPKTNNFWWQILPISAVTAIGGLFLGVQLLSASAPTDQKQCPVIRGLTNIQNSCYLDSVILALFAVPIPAIDNVFLEKNLDDLRDIPEHQLQKICESNRKSDIIHRKEMQAALTNMVHFIRGQSASPTTCAHFRASISKCRLPQEANFVSGRTQDANEFLLFLLQLFEVRNAVSETELFRPVFGPQQEENAKLSFKWTRTKREFSPVAPIVLISTGNYKGPDLKKYLQYTDDNKEENRVATRTTIVEAGFLAFIITRRLQNNKLFKKPLGITEQVQLATKKPSTYHLQSAVVFQTGHYLTYFRCPINEMWYVYNDLGPSLKILGTFENMLHAKPDVQTHGVILIYVPKN